MGGRCCIEPHGPAERVARKSAQLAGCPPAGAPSRDRPHLVQAAEAAQRLSPRAKAGGRCCIEPARREYISAGGPPPSAPQKSAHELAQQEQTSASGKQSFWTIRLRMGVREDADMDGVNARSIAHCTTVDIFEAINRPATSGGAPAIKKRKRDTGKLPSWDMIKEVLFRCVLNAGGLLPNALASPHVDDALTTDWIISN